MPLLADDEIRDGLSRVAGWELRDRSIERVFKLEDFAGAMRFVNRVADLAEEANHHPDIAISWNRVTLTLTTHSQGGLTGSDFALAGRIDEIA